MDRDVVETAFHLLCVLLISGPALCTLSSDDIRKKFTWYALFNALIDVGCAMSVNYAACK